MSAELKWRTEMGEQSEESILSGAKRASSDVEIEGRGSGHVARRARRRNQRGWSYCWAIKEAHQSISLNAHVLEVRKIGSEN